mgnify:CR=1 FL=1
MSGGLPSGGDPGQFDLGAFGIAGASGISGLAENTQTNVENYYKSQIAGSNSINNQVDAIFDGLRQAAGLPLAIIESIIKRILAPFGLDDEFEHLVDALNHLVHAITHPFQTISNLLDSLHDMFEGLWAKLASAGARINALEVSLGAGDEVGGYDNCSKLDKFDIIDPGMFTFMGAISGSNRSAALYEDAPATDKCGVGVKVTSRRAGLTKAVICSDDDMTNYAALELTTNWNGKDVARIVTGTGVTTTMTQTSMPVYVRDNSFWEIRYDPYEEGSETSNTFRVYKNGEELVPLRWRDEGNQVLHGVGQRKTGVVVNGWNQLIQTGMAVTDFTWYDWTATAGV